MLDFPKKSYTPATGIYQFSEGIEPKEPSLLYLAAPDAVDVLRQKLKTFKALPAMRPQSPLAPSF